jgi:hypothetical protein
MGAILRLFEKLSGRKVNLEGTIEATAKVDHTLNNFSLFLRR